MIRPHADSGFAIVREPGAALVPGGFSVPAVPEHVAFLLVREDTVQAGTMGCVDGWLELRPLAAVDVVEVIAVFGEELAVARVERKTVAAGLYLRGVVVAFPVLVAGYVMGVESKVVWTFERLLGGHACNGRNVKVTFYSLDRKFGQFLVMVFITK